MRPKYAMKSTAKPMPQPKITLRDLRVAWNAKQGKTNREAQDQQRNQQRRKNP
jgi:hypothetical protein